jgi:hypothetical protein
MSAESYQSFFSFFENIILTKNGIWLSEGEEITHERTLLAFSRNIHRCKDGFEIRIGKESKTVHIEDTIFFVTSIEGAPEIGFSIHLNDQRVLELDPQTLQYKPGRLTCRVFDPNSGLNEEAKFLSPAYYEILKYMNQDESGFSITIEGHKIILGKSGP